MASVGRRWWKEGVGDGARPIRGTRGQRVENPRCSLDGEVARGASCYDALACKYTLYRLGGSTVVSTDVHGHGLKSSPRSEISFTILTCAGAAKCDGVWCTVRL